MEFLSADWLGTPAWFWLSFLGLVAVLTAFDLGVLNRTDQEMSIARSLKLSAFYISIAMLFGVWVWIEKGADLGLKYYTGFFIEKALSIDNVFVISLIFTYFAIPRMYQYRALVWGIMAVIVLRGIMIGVGAAVVQEWYWVLYIFAAFLIVTGIKMFFAGDQPMDVGGNPVVRWISSHMRVTKELHDQHLFVTVPDEKALVRIASDVVRSPAAGTAVIAAGGPARVLDLTASRRLTLFAERSGVTAILLRTRDPQAPSAAATRWQVAAAPSIPLEADAPGHPAFAVDLVRQRAGAPSPGWQLEWRRDAASFTSLPRIVPAAAGGGFVASA